MHYPLQEQAIASSRTRVANTPRICGPRAPLPIIIIKLTRLNKLELKMSVEMRLEYLENFHKDILFLKLLTIDVTL